MAEMGRFAGHVFTVMPALVRSFSDLTIKGSSETEDMEGDGQKYVSRKNSKPAEITLTVRLNAAAGVNVRDEAMAFVTEAQSGVTDYFYVGTQKLVTCQVMLTDAQVSEVRMTPSGNWMSADVKLTLKQGSNADGIMNGSPVSASGGGGGGGGGGGSSGGGGGGSSGGGYYSAGASEGFQGAKVSVRDYVTTGVNFGAVGVAAAAVVDTVSIASEWAASKIKEGMSSTSTPSKQTTYEAGSYVRRMSEQASESSKKTTMSRSAPASSTRTTTTTRAGGRMIEGA